MGNIHSKNNGWTPKVNTAFELYEAAGKDWKKVDASQIKGVDKKHEMWGGMPKETLAYIRSLPEYDADIFEEITGLNSLEPKETIVIGDITYDKADVEQRLKGIKPIGG